ncbi:MAG: stage II sporulation protein M [Promethearchaeota archaeon]
MALQDLTLLTIMFEFVPPLVASLIYLAFFGKRKSKFIEAFIALMYLKTVSFFILNIAIWGPSVGGGFDAGVNTPILSWLLLTDMLFQFVTSLQEYLIWVMVSFFAVLFGMVVLAAKLALQDPMKMRFSNLIHSITRREPETDGYAGFSDRVANIRFEGVEPEPLNPEVQSRAWRDAWRDYLIIGLVTLVPSISVYVGDLPSFIVSKIDPIYYDQFLKPDAYLLNVAIFVIWIYRFGYPASNRIAKGAGLRLGDRDIGSEMMRGVLGWFFRLNILLTVGIFGIQTIQAFNSGIADVASIMIDYYALGIGLAVPPIIFAIIVLPLVEDFAVVLYKKVFESLTQASSKISTMNLGSALKNIISSLGSGLVVAGAFVAAVFATTMSYAIEHGQFLFFPGSVDDEFIQDALRTPANNVEMLGETFWLLIMLAIPFVMMIALGIIGHYVTNRTKGGIETFALVSGVTLSVSTYVLLPNLDYIVSFGVTPATYAGEVFNRLRPILYLPAQEQLLYRYASQFIVNLPIFVFATLFIMYFFKFRESWRTKIGETAGPLLHVSRRDIVQSAAMFFGGLLIAILGIWMISTAFVDPFYFRNLLTQLLQKIANPDGLEGVLPPPTDFLTREQPLGWFVVFAEHNMVRILLMMVMGPIFWSAVLWYVGARKSDSEASIGTWTIVTMVVGAAVTYLWTQYDASQGLFNPLDPRWGFAAQLGLRALVIFGVLFLIFGLAAALRNRNGKGVGVWWFPLFITLFAAEYFIYDDQFTLIALIILPIFLAGGYKLTSRGRNEEFLISYIKFGLMSIAIAEVLSTALTLGGIAIIEYSFGVGALEFLARIIPHAIVEIPTFLVAAAASIRIAKDLWPTIENEDWESVPSRTRALLSDGRTWRTYVLIAVFIIIAALIEAFVTPIVFWIVQGL